jgi:hypothetical protein
MAPKASVCNWNNGGREDLRTRGRHKAVLPGQVMSRSRTWCEIVATVSTKGARGLARTLRGLLIRCPPMACAVQRRRFPVGASPTRQPLQPEAIGAVMEVTKWLKPSISVSRIGDSASVQAATRLNAEQASKRTMCRPTRRPYRGRLKWLGEMSEEYAQLLHRGIGGGM